MSARVQMAKKEPRPVPALMWSQAQDGHRHRTVTVPSAGTADRPQGLGPVLGPHGQRDLEVLERVF